MWCCRHPLGTHVCVLQTISLLLAYRELRWKRDCVLDCLSALCFRDRLTHLVTVPTGAVLLGIRLFVILVVADFLFYFIFYFLFCKA